MFQDVSRLIIAAALHCVAQCCRMLGSWAAFAQRCRLCTPSRSHPSQVRPAEEVWGRDTREIHDTFRPMDAIDGHRTAQKGTDRDEEWIRMGMT